MRKRFIRYEYKLHPSMSDTVCFYCGHFGQSKDHVPPVSIDGEFIDIERILVKCCLLCNSLLGNRPYFELITRCNFLVTKYPIRFKKALSMPNWTKEEIDSLSGKLKRQVISGLKKKKWIENKLLFLNIRIQELADD